MDEIRITGDEAVLISRIRTIDRDLDELERQTREMVQRGLRGGGPMARLGEDRADADRAALLRERAELVERLKRSTGVG
ncbi:hypothetical protein [Amnibacterium setariae]|uniref:Uncharacterized protein n=1 Tax=Amnibacterium setariae TaxID=2306585 RepID=A0A3A1TZX9_9MICO|nr:hypothetical protein [Amnibacterium setariae]RIX28245.1 hypothetical protein D1781_12340 [Amnibacterium setariae]